MDRARLLIVDDDADIRKALRRLLTAENWDVCGEAADGVEAIEAVRRLNPDLILTDLFMPRMSGIDAADNIRQEFPTMRIMLLTAADSDIDIQEAARSKGIRGTVWKGAADSIVRGIHALLRGEEFHQVDTGGAGSSDDDTATGR